MARRSKKPNQSALMKARSALSKSADLLTERNWQGVLLVVNPALEQLKIIDDYENEQALLLERLGITYAIIGEYEQTFDCFHEGYMKAESEQIQQAITEQYNEVCSWFTDQAPPKGWRDELLSPLGQKSDGCNPESVGVSCSHET